MSEQHEALVAALRHQQPEKKPKVDELAIWAGVDKVSGAERDAAWKEYRDGATAPQGDETPWIIVRTKAPGHRRRRAGFAFTDKPVCLPVDTLTNDQVEALEADVHLKVEHTTAPAGQLVEA